MGNMQYASLTQGMDASEGRVFRMIFNTPARTRIDSHNPF